MEHVAPMPMTLPMTMVPDLSRLPDTLPTDRLMANGMAVPELRQELRRINGPANALSIFAAWMQAAVTIGLAVWIAHPAGYVVAVILMGPAFARFAILGHEGAHKLLFTNKRANDLVGRWLVAYPAFVPFEAYRRSHFAHHKDPFGPNEPDLGFYSGYPVDAATLRRRLRRDAVGISGWKNLKALIGAVASPTARPFVWRIFVAQFVLLALFTAFGRPELYVVLWLLPWMTSLRVINRLRSIAEHGGMHRSTDSRQTTHHVHQSKLASFWIAPYNTGWHLAHHVDMGVPWRNLPALHRELEAAGWMTPDLEYASYRALWSALSSRPAVLSDSSGAPRSS